MNDELEKLSSEQAADLARLESLAAEEAAPGALEAEQAVVNNRAALADEIAGMLMALQVSLSPALPSLKRIYTPETTAAVGSSVAAVCAKRGWLSGGLMGEYAEEFACGMIVIPLAVATYQGVKGDVDNLKESAPGTPAAVAKAAPPAAVVAGVVAVPDQPSGQGVTFGAPVTA